MAIPMLKESLDQFVRINTAHFDESHDYSHALSVYQNTMIISNSNEFAGKNLDMELLTYASMLHDVRDHKYPQSITREQLYEFLLNELEQIKADQVLTIIENVSFSKQEKIGNSGFPLSLIDYVNIVRDADRLEAIGSVGIRRCQIYHDKVLGQSGDEAVRNIVKHCHEKLVRLYPEYFIITSKGRELAKPLHDEILEYLNSN